MRDFGILSSRTQRISGGESTLGYAPDAGGNVNTNDLGPEYWAVIAMIGGLPGVLARRIQKFVPPRIRKICEQSEMEDEVTGLSTPLLGSS